MRAVDFASAPAARRHSAARLLVADWKRAHGAFAGAGIWFAPERVARAKGRPTQIPLPFHLLKACRDSLLELGDTSTAEALVDELEWAVGAQDDRAAVAAARLRSEVLARPDATIRESVPPPLPAWRALKVRSIGMGFYVAHVDGQAFRLRGRQVEFLNVLKKSRGAPVKGYLIESTLGVRPDRVLKGLPDRLRRMIEPPGRGHSGYRLL